MTPAFINTRKSAAMLLGIMPCTAHRHRGRFPCEWVIKPTGKIQPPIKVSSMDIPSRVSRLEERAENHGDAARDMRIKQGMTETDIKDIYSQINVLKGSLRAAKWIYGSIIGIIAIAVEWFRK